MKRVIAIANRKGGVGKTTTALFLSQWLSAAGFSTCAIDADPQGSLTQCALTQPVQTTLNTALTGGSVTEAIHDSVMGFDIIPSSPRLSATEAGLSVNSLKEITDRLPHDFVIIDCPPTFSNLTAVALRASTEAVIPCECDMFSPQGLVALLTLIRGVNPALRIDGILITKYKARQSQSEAIKGVLETVARQAGTDVFPQPIRESVAIRKCLLMRQNLFKAYKREKVAQDYMGFCLSIQQEGFLL